LRSPVRKKRLFAGDRKGRTCKAEVRWQGGIGLRYRVLSKYRSELMGAAMLWVMLFHAQDLKLGIPPVDLILNAGFGGVDVFVLLAGVGLVHSLMAREQKFLPFMARRCTRILPGYYVVMVGYTLFQIVRGAAPASTLFWNATLLSYWVRAEGAFNWYVTGILLYYAMTPFWLGRLKASRRREWLTAGAVAFGLGLCRYLLDNGGWHYQDVAYRLPVYLLGLLLGLYVWEDRKLGQKDLVFWSVWLVCGGAYLAAAFTTDPDVLYLPLCHLFLFTTVPMCLVGCLLFEKLPLGGLRRLLRLMGENSLEIYLLNVSFFSETALLQRYLDFGPGHYIYYAITIPLNIALGVLLHRGMGSLRKSRVPARP